VDENNLGVGDETGLLPTHIETSRSLIGSKVRVLTALGRVFLLLAAPMGGCRIE